MYHLSHCTHTDASVKTHKTCVIVLECLCVHEFVSLLGCSLCLSVFPWSDACSHTSTALPCIGGARRRWSPRKDSWRRRLLLPCCRERPCNFRGSTPPHLLSVRTPPRLPRMAVCVTGWPKFSMRCIPSDVGGCMRLAIAVRPAYGGQTRPDCPSAPGFLFPCFWLGVHQPRIFCPEHARIECRHSGEPALSVHSGHLGHNIDGQVVTAWMDIFGLLIGCHHPRRKPLCTRDIHYRVCHGE